MLNPLFKPMTMCFQNEEGGEGGGGVAAPPAMLDESGNFTEDFYNTFDEDDRTTISRYKNPSELGKGHINLRRMSDKPPDRLAVVPNEDSPDEEIAAFNQKWGVPEQPQGYEYKPDAEIAEKTGFNEDVMQGYFEKAKELQLNRKQLKGMADYHLSVLSKQGDEFALVQAANEQKELEADNKIADDYFGKSKNERIARADMLLQKYGNVEIKNEKGEVVANAIDKLIEKHPSLKHDPYFAMIFDKIAEDMSPMRIQGITGVSTPTNAAIQVKIKELRSNPAYLDQSHPDHKRLNNEVTELYKQMKS